MTSQTYSGPQTLLARIFLSPPHIDADERRHLLDALDSNWVAPAGPDLEAFERELADYVGVPCAAGLCSGTAALHLALRLVGVGQGDDVIVPTFTFVATAAAAIYLGATPVLVDCDPATWNLDPDLLADELAQAAARGRLPAAVVTVDVYGQCANYARIERICADYGVPLVEDAAEALGATYCGRPAGAFGNAAIFSFNGNKIITTSAGGMLVSSDPALVARARHLATQAREPASYYQHEEIGYNYRMSNLLAAVGRAQLAKLDDRVLRRREVNAFYRAALGDLPGVSFMPIDPDGEPNFWLTCVLVDADRGIDREKLRVRLEEADVESRPTWKPLHLQPALARCRTVGGSVAEDIFERGLCLPSGSSLSDADLDRVVSTIRDLLC